MIQININSSINRTLLYFGCLLIIIYSNDQFLLENEHNINLTKKTRYQKPIKYIYCTNLKTNI